MISINGLQQSQLGIELSEAEGTAFTGDQPQVTYPILPPSVATTPRPQP